jgi:SAM-dependent methyltransferase
MIDRVMQVSPSARQHLLRFWYQLLPRLDPTGVMLFMNYGYADRDPAPPLALRAEDEPYRYCIQLYHHVVTAIDIRGHDILEVGCGRGGGTAFLSRYLEPHTVTGLDYSQRAIRYCAKRHHATGARFVPGHAERLPFDAAAFDAVLNVESSHCYPSTARFLGEVARILRPGGRLLYADFRARADMADWRGQFAAAGFRLQQEHNITSNVERALDLDHDRRLALIQQHAPRPLQARFGMFVGLRGSPIYTDFERGELEYWSFVLCKGEAG